MPWTSKADRYLGKVNAEEQMKGLLPWQGPFNSLYIVNEIKESVTFFLWVTVQLIHLLNKPLLLGFGKPSPSHRREKAQILHSLSCLWDSTRKRQKQTEFYLVLVVWGMAENWSVCRWTFKWRNSEYARKGETGLNLEAKYWGVVADQNRSVYTKAMPAI